jgi:hypothetical protein
MTTIRRGEETSNPAGSPAVSISGPSSEGQRNEQIDEDDRVKIDTDPEEAFSATVKTRRPMSRPAG